MSDIIQLLPDNIANQIAAGEVVQRPASVVKELLENAIDSGADSIQLIIKDAGKTLIQVIDNGCGMSETDARMCFERHATSKIKKAEDLFAIYTMGFRGEALASIASVAQIELKTKPMTDEVGTLLMMEGSNVKEQSACSMGNQTNFIVKNLFFNIPARRNFLKSNRVESRHIIDEFTRIALSQTHISFILNEDGKQKFSLPKDNLKQRIVQLFGKSYNEKLIPVNLDTDIVKITGFIGKPENAKKSKGEQFFFVNKRFIKHYYFNHAVNKAFDELIPSDFHPSFFLFFEINPKEIDINIHPTKTEVNFLNAQVIYSMLRSAVKQSLGKFSITPSIDFNPENSFNTHPLPKGHEVKQPQITVDPDFNPFNQSIPNADSERKESNQTHWRKLYQDENAEPKAPPPIDFRQLIVEKEATQEEMDLPIESSIDKETTIFQIKNRYIVYYSLDRLMLIDQKRAYERIFFDRFIRSIESQKSIIQKLLFSETLELSSSDTDLLNEILDEIKAIGFDIDFLGGHSFVINGCPALLINENQIEIIESMLNTYKSNMFQVNIDKMSNIARSFAQNIAKRKSKKIEKEELQSLINELLISSAPEISPSGKTIIKILSYNEIEKMF